MVLIAKKWNNSRKSDLPAGGHNPGETGGKAAPSGVLNIIHRVFHIVMSTALRRKSWGMAKMTEGTGTNS